MKKNVTVYCSSRHVPEVYLKAAYDIGVAIASRGLDVVYGGGTTGCMGELARGALGSGGGVIAVRPKALGGQMPQSVKLKEIWCASLAERKAKMEELSDIFVVLPGGIGTLDELSQIMALQHLHMKACSCFLLNLCGFYDPILKQFEDWIKLGFIDSKDLKRELHIIKNIAEFERRLDSIAMD